MPNTSTAAPRHVQGDRRCGLHGELDRGLEPSGVVDQAQAGDRDGGHQDGRDLDRAARRDDPRDAEARRDGGTAEIRGRIDVGLVRSRMVDEAEPDRGPGGEGRREERDQARDAECEAVPDGVRELVEGLQHRSADAMAVALAGQRIRRKRPPDPAVGLGRPRPVEAFLERLSGVPAHLAEVGVPHPQDALGQGGGIVGLDDDPATVLLGDEGGFGGRFHCGDIRPAGREDPVDLARDDIAGQPRRRPTTCTSAAPSESESVS